MKDDQLLRYSRHILLDDIDVTGQQALLDATVLVIGVGGLGSPVALYLAASGVGHLILCDDDKVELSNLQRQVIHTTSRIGQQKATSAETSLKDLNPDCRLTLMHSRLAGEQLDQAVQAADVVVDCSDNFDTRFALNQACKTFRKPLVSGAAIQWEGQVSVFDHRDASSACYRCLYGPGANNLSCSESGVVAPLVGIIGTVQALEAVKFITSAGASLTNRLLLLDGKVMRWQEIRLQKDPSCPCCGI
ncbi:molybdopterin-synthase adenylyltransferase MoeB [Simiduia curdlanivorans]|uniref:HesA/MoeB/ThiF family protein n=1 Tax=Simiduia curdlanivorans TaxID=1492769 RepID=A0ABV8V4U1_9GAMM|nr:molybdopterin-synthase adenylyltransferase MoeB [Simiduia curdlanivorans]MDN3638394.1 molybdopterin-synthase adenylyltransferase MoeB [Simiduia curdlanivorans]